MLVDRKSMAELSAAIGLRFSFGLRLQTSDELEKLIDMNKRRRQARADLLTPRSLSMLARISKAGGAFEKLTEPQIRVFLRYLELNCVFRSNVTGRFGNVTDDFGNVTGHFGNVTER
ncbi:hypothetical protein DOT66_25840, partial [Ralstonia pseudosolanacearum]